MKIIKAKNLTSRDLVIFILSPNVVPKVVFHAKPEKSCLMFYHQIYSKILVNILELSYELFLLNFCYFLENIKPESFHYPGCTQCTQVHY